MGNNTRMNAKTCLTKLLIKYQLTLLENTTSIELLEHIHTLRHYTRQTPL